VNGRRGSLETVNRSLQKTTFWERTSQRTYRTELNKRGFQTGSTSVQRKACGEDKNEGNTARRKKWQILRSTHESRTCKTREVWVSGQCIRDLAKRRERGGLQRAPRRCRAMGSSEGMGPCETLETFDPAMEIKRKKKKIINVFTEGGELKPEKVAFVSGNRSCGAAARYESWKRGRGKVKRVGGVFGRTRAGHESVILRRKVPIKWLPRGKFRKRG